MELGYKAPADARAAVDPRIEEVQVGALFESFKGLAGVFGGAERGGDECKSFIFYSINVIMDH